jgi:hypothetical protein
MTTKYPKNPEVIATLRSVNSHGDDAVIGDKVAGFGVLQDEKGHGLLQLDVRNFKGGANLVIEIDLAEAVAAISLATLNADREA